MVQVPHLVYAETAQTDLAAVGLELGRQDEVPSDAATVGMVIEQTPAQGTQVEESTPVDIVVSTGPGQAPMSGQQAPISSGQDEEKQGEKQQEEVEKQGEKQQQEAEKQREKQQEEVEKQNEE
jgi:beta-lactam-binding protein with PASTA domain